MPKKSRKFNYAKARDALKKIGYDVAYSARDRSTFRTRGTIRRLYNEKAPYIKYIEKPREKLRARVTKEGQLKSVVREKSLFTFKKLTPTQKRMAKKSGIFSREQFTKGGVIIEKPANVRGSDYKVTFTDKEVKIKFGKRRDIVRRIDAKRLASNPEKEIARVLGELKPNSYGLIVNGFSGPVYPANRFWWYMKNKLLPQFMERAEVSDGDDFDGDETAEEFSDIFHVRIML